MTASAFAGTVLIVALLWIIADSDDRPDKIRLGATIPLTGVYKTNGANTLYGYRIAIDKINRMGGVEVGGEKYDLELIYYDDHSDTGLATSNAELLIQGDGVKYMLGPYSSELTNAVARVTKAARIPLVEAEGASPSLFIDNKYIFGLLSTSEYYMPGITRLVVQLAKKHGKDPKHLKLAIAVKNDRFSLHVQRAVQEAAGAYGIKIVIDEKLPVDIEDLSGLLKMVREQKPDILIISGHSNGAEVAARQIGELQVKVPVIGLTHCEAARITEKYSDAAEGILCPAQWASSLPYEGTVFSAAQAFADEIRIKYPAQNYDEVPYQSASAAAAIIIWRDAFERANSFDTEELRDALAGTDLKTFYGRIKFQKNGAIDNDAKPMVLRQIQNGKYVVVWPLELAEAAFQTSLYD